MAAGSSIAVIWKDLPIAEGGFLEGRGHNHPDALAVAVSFWHDFVYLVKAGRVDRGMEYT